MIDTSRRLTRMMGVSTPLLGLYVVASLALQASPVSVLMITYLPDRQKVEDVTPRSSAHVHLQSRTPQVVVSGHTFICVPPFCPY